MGMSLLFSSSCWKASKGKPVDSRFEIVSLEQIGGCCIAMVRYPKATQYNGLKCLLYVATKEQIENALLLDPHFSEARGPIVPVARFEPTVRGVRIARALARMAM